MAKSTNRLSVTLDADVQAAIADMRPQWGEQREMINTALRRHLKLRPSGEEPQDAEERAIVREVLALYRQLSKDGNADVIRTIIESLRRLS